MRSSADTYVPGVNIPSGYPGFFNICYDSNDEDDLQYADKIIPTNTMLDKTYEFEIELETEAGQKLKYTSKMTLIVGCPTPITDL